MVQDASQEELEKDWHERETENQLAYRESYNPYLDQSVRQRLN